MRERGFRRQIGLVQSVYRIYGRAFIPWSLQEGGDFRVALSGFGRASRVRVAKALCAGACFHWTRWGVSVELRGVRKA